jgi:4-amino-4-deoxy-L-arabinose transferase-like glycosyltransferase
VDIRDIFLYCVVIIVSFLLFFNLGNQYLWQDEADCAVLGVNILRYGFPRCFDGKNLVPSDVGYGKNYLWIFLPWLQNYLAAASFALLGKPSPCAQGLGKYNFTARFPFALLGLGSILLTYLLALRLFGNRRIAQISILLLSLSIPYLLHIRQCRYYAPVIFFTLWSLIAYLRFIEGHKTAAFEFVVSSTLLFHSNIGLF